MFHVVKTSGSQGMNSLQAKKLPKFSALVESDNKKPTFVCCVLLVSVLEHRLPESSSLLSHLSPTLPANTHIIPATHVPQGMLA